MLLAFGRRADAPVAIALEGVVARAADWPVRRLCAVLARCGGRWRGRRWGGNVPAKEAEDRQVEEEGKAMSQRRNTRGRTAKRNPEEERHCPSSGRGRDDDTAATPVVERLLLRSHSHHQHHDVRRVADLICKVGD